MRKIGVLTYLREYANLGTNMQSYSTLQAIRGLYPGDRVELLDYAPRRGKRRPYLSQLSLRSLKNDFVRMAKYDDFFENMLTLSAERLVSPDPARALEFIKRQEYQAIYVGADTVLELKGAGQDALTPYWLDRSIDCKKFLIAASSHNLVYSSLSAAQIAKMQEVLDGFALLGVRDDATRRLLSHFVPAGDPRLQLVPDPTFTYDIDYRQVESYLARRGFLRTKPVVCLHLLRDTSWGRQLSERFRKLGFLVASLRPAYWADLLFTDLSPFEQVGLYRYFDLVITHRFHDAIFCFKNHTPVIFFPEYVSDVTPFHESKTLTLFKGFGLDGACYLEDKDQITPEHLMAGYRHAVEGFRARDALIAELLVQFKARYLEFAKLCRSHGAGTDAPGTGSAPGRMTLQGAEEEHEDCDHLSIA